MASRGRGARIKGANFEREMAKLFTEELGLSFKRGLGQTRGGGAEVADVEGEDNEQNPFHFELKRHKRCNIKSAMVQAGKDVAESSSNKIPVAVTKDDREPIYATLLLDDFLKLAKVYIDHVTVQKGKT
jgi:Holliday junction resolvase